MTIYTKTISALAHDELHSCSVFTVHSVYRNTINITNSNGLLYSIQSAGSPLSPVSLITDASADDLNALQVTPGDKITIKNDTLLFPNASILEFGSADIHQLTLKENAFHSSNASERSVLSSSVFSALSFDTPSGFTNLFLEEPMRIIKNPLVFNYAYTVLKTATSLLQQQNYSEAAASLCKLIGLGIGLTPSGDDFLCGTLTGLRGLNLWNSTFAAYLKKYIKKSLDNTNDISRTFLQCALLGQCSEAVIHLSVSSSPQEIFQDFHAIGHSSGMDTLCGIFYILSHYDCILPSSNI